MQNHLKVVISSTLADLPEHRKEVMEACLRLGMFPLMSEQFPASPGDAITDCLSLVDRADIFIGVYGYRYGFVPEGSERSIMELEYDRATERRIPTLIFIIDRDHPVRVGDIESNSVEFEKLSSFKSKVERQHIVDYFKSPADLKAKVINALVRFRESVQQHDERIKEVTARTRQLLRVFVASPSDVREERQKMPRVVKSLNRTLGLIKNAVVELWKWEDDATPGVGEPQSLIDPELDKADAVVVIFWNRFGLETSTGETGTEREVLRSFKRWNEQKRPQILMYFCQRPAVLNKEQLLQRVKVLEFRDNISSMALTVDYEDISEFEWRVRDDLFLTLAQFCEECS